MPWINGVEHGARGVDRRGIAGRAGSDDHELGVGNLAVEGSGHRLNPDRCGRRPRPICPDAARETGLVGLGCQATDKTPFGSQTGSLSKDSGELCKLRNPRHPQALAASFPPVEEGPGASLQGKKRMAGASPAISHMHNEMGRARLLPLDLHHLIGFGPARRDDLDLRAFLLADESAGQRRGDGNLAFFGVRFRLADDLPHRLFVGVFVD